MSKTLIAKMKINRPAKYVYDAFADPAKIKNFWFSGSSGYWETGRTITLSYEEYAASFDIIITEAVPYSKISFPWGDAGSVRTNTLTFAEESGSTIVTAEEAGFEDSQIAEMLQNQTGWVYMLCCLKAYLENGVTTLRTGLVMS